MASDVDGDVVLAGFSASSLTSPGSAQEEKQSRGLDTRAIVHTQDHQQPSFTQSTSDALPRGKQPKVEFTSIPSTPPSRRVAPSDYSPATPSVRRRLFSSPATPLEFPDENRPIGSLGLGITGSPSGGRAPTHIRKKIVAGKGAQARQSVSAIKKNEKPDPTSDAEKDNDRKKSPVITENEKSTDAEKNNGQMKKGKGNQRRVQKKNRMKKMKIKMQMRKMRMRMEMKSREENVQPSGSSDSRNSGTTNQVHSRVEIPGDEYSNQAETPSPPLAQVRHCVADTEVSDWSSDPGHSDTENSEAGSDSDSESESMSDGEIRLKLARITTIPTLSPVEASAISDLTTESATMSKFDDPEPLWKVEMWSRPPVIHAPKPAIASNPDDSSTDSDSPSESKSVVQDELFGHLKPQPPEPVGGTYRGYFPSHIGPA